MITNNNEKVKKENKSIIYAISPEILIENLII